ncbi:hypothetical protein VKT23_014109 [Stygiomarasmius scandens]|uniref:Uncharacterized protein n=1 Tax=Marasmiellus scandens TaxID=2682957 RepID=A0ABR1J181_9AGAR
MEMKERFCAGQCSTQSRIHTRTIQQNTRVNEEKVKSRNATIDQLHFFGPQHPVSSSFLPSARLGCSHAPSLSHASVSFSSQNSSHLYSPPGTLKLSVLSTRVSFP